MRKTLLLMGCIVIFFVAINGVNAQILSPISSLEGKVSQDTMVFFIGKTEVTGDFQGFEIDSLIDSALFEDIENALNNPLVPDIIDLSLLQNPRVIPLIGSNYLDDIDIVTIVDIQDIQNFDFESMSLEDILNFVDSVESFSNVNIIAENGPFLVGSGQEIVSIESKFDFSISSLTKFEFEGYNIPFLILLSDSDIEIEYSGDALFLLSANDLGNIIIEDYNGNEIWNEDLSNKLFFIEDKDISFNPDSSLHIFPISSGDFQEKAYLSIYPAEAGKDNINLLMESISNITNSLGFGDISDITESFEGFDEIISIASPVINGGMALIQTNDVFRIDDSFHTFSNFGFARGDSFDVTISGGDNPEANINGNFKLIFLGDHFYNSQAKNSENGVAFPFFLVIFWIIAIILFIIFRFYLKKESKQELDQRFKKYAFLIHIVILIFVFILIDREISFQFGISAIDVLLGQGLSIISGVLIVVEIVMWILGFIFLAIPISIIVNYTFKIFRKGKGSKEIGKIIGAFSIWFFCAYYVKLIINLIFLIINPNNFLPMG